MVVNYWQSIRFKIEKLKILPSKRSSLKSLKKLHQKLKCIKLTKVFKMVSKKDRNKPNSQINKKINLYKFKQSKITFQTKSVSNREKARRKITSLKYLKEDNRSNN